MIADQKLSSKKSTATREPVEQAPGRSEKDKRMFLVFMLRR
jgi:hypothetical protein